MHLSKAAKQSLWRFAPSIYDCLRSKTSDNEFSIGVLSGQNLAALNQSSVKPTPVLSRSSVTDVPAVFVADPFILKRQDTWYMFFEIMSHLDYKGCIGCATSTDGVKWHYEQVVLEEPFHLAYPHVFEHDNQIYMVPDSFGNGVQLYRADHFPDRWVLEKVLITDKNLCDSSLFFHEDRWWNLCCDRTDKQDSLKIFYADRLLGPWQEHDAGAVTAPIDQRPAGRVVSLNGKLHRFVQNREGNYAEYVRMRQIEKITPTEFLESADTSAPLLHGSGTGWNADGMHHIDICLSGENSFLASVDGVQRR